MARYGIVLDLNRCTGCMTCVIACKQENLTRPGVWWDRVLEAEDESLDRIVYFRYACMHCDNPPCAKACPEQAIYKRSDGIVLIDHERCKGHGECAKACPYGVIELNPERDYFAGERVPFDDIRMTRVMHPPGKASTCNLCVHRIEQGREPACVEECPSKVMLFGDLDDPNSSMQKKLRKSEQLLASQGTQPKVSYIFPKNTWKQVEHRIAENPRME
ncbi:MAG: 4Fe-4S dicluster domain-containing protein [Deltaproteobacteria bacterium]|nr:4Fe-4S dicluster domain-containing protein [Deltaproteobacteria bacterium]